MTLERNYSRDIKTSCEAEINNWHFDSSRNNYRIIEQKKSIYGLADPVFGNRLELEAFYGSRAETISDNEQILWNTLHEAILKARKSYKKPTEFQEDLHHLLNTATLLSNERKSASWSWR